MGFYATTKEQVKPQQGRPSCAPKTASGKFFASNRNHAYKIERNPLNLHQGTRPTPTKTASGVFYYKYRHYDPALGRWPSRDLIEERGGVNLYGFVGNEPIGRWDKYGLAANSEIEVTKEKLDEAIKNLIDEGGREAYNLSIEDLKQRIKRYADRRKARKPFDKQDREGNPKVNFEYGGRICIICSKSDSKGNPTHYKIYRTASVTSRKTNVLYIHDIPACKKGYITKGIFHNHPNQNMNNTHGGGLSGGDKRSAKLGKYLTFPKLYNEGKKHGMKHGYHYHDELRIHPNSLVGATYRSKEGVIITDFYNSRTGERVDILPPE